MVRSANCDLLLLRKPGNQIGAMKKYDSESIINLLDKPTSDRRPLFQELRRNAPAAQLILALKKRPANGLTRHLLCDLLGYRRVKSAVPILVQFLDDADSGVRSAAAESLSKIEDQSAGSQLFERLKKEKDIGTRRALIIALGAVGFKGAIETLIEALNDDDEAVRGVAAWSLGALKAQQARSILVKMLSNETNTFILDNVREALTQIGSLNLQ